MSTCGRNNLFTLNTYMYSFKSHLPFKALRITENFIVRFISPVLYICTMSCQRFGVPLSFSLCTYYYSSKLPDDPRYVSYPLNPASFFVADLLLPLRRSSWDTRSFQHLGIIKNILSPQCSWHEIELASAMYDSWFSLGVRKDIRSCITRYYVKFHV